MLMILILRFILSSDIDEPKISESHLILPDESSKLMNKFAQAPDAEHPSELITPVVPVPLENGSA